MLGGEERVMLPLLELAVESSDVTVPSVSSCLLACAWLAMLPKTTGRARSLGLPKTGPRARLSCVIDLLICLFIYFSLCKVWSLVVAWVDLSHSHQTRNVY